MVERHAVAETTAERFGSASVGSYALALASGGAIAGCFLDFALWPLGWLAFAPLLVALPAPCTRGAATRIAIVAGMATNVPAFWWLVWTIHVFGGFPVWLSALFYIGLSFWASLEFVLFGLAVRRVGLGPLAVYPALVWVTLEFWFPNLFPWRLANSQFHLPVMIQIGDVTGPFGLSFVMVWMSGAIALAVRAGVRKASPAIAIAVAAVAAIAAYGRMRLPTVDEAISAGRPVRLGIVQGNLSIEEKQNVRYLEGNIGTYRKLSQTLEPPPDVVIWPESVITEPLPRTLRALSPTGREILGLQRPLFAGALTYEGDATAPRFYNSIILFDADGKVLGLSDKQILMPFGEYMPFGSVLPWLKQLSPQTGDFQAGSEARPLDVPGIARFAPLNCYEDLRSAIARRATRDGGTEILFAVANDGWFGDTPAPFQHEALALWRAIENRRFLVRVTNTGVTDVIDPAGRVLLRLPVFQPAATVAEVVPLKWTTIYTRWGDWFAWLVTGLTAIVLVIGAGSRGRSEPPNPPRPRA